MKNPGPEQGLLSG